MNGVDVFRPNEGEVKSSGPDQIACWFVDTDYDEESFFVRHAYFLGANDPYKSLKTTLKAEVDEDAWASLHSDTSRPFPKPKSGRIAVKVINHLGGRGDEGLLDRGMTQFWREGFWRTSVYGNDHHVEGHWVEREDWSRSADLSGGGRNSALSRLREARAASSATARYIVPNAACPVCGADVFFFRNEHGSRVFFDELGPPWPKHPCTDQNAETVGNGSVASIKVTLRHPEDVRLIAALNKQAGIRSNEPFRRRFGSERWKLFRVDYRARSESGAALI